MAIHDPGARDQDTSRHGAARLSYRGWSIAAASAVGALTGGLLGLLLGPIGLVVGIVTGGTAGGLVGTVAVEQE